jgi:hypothetical protein
LGFLSKSGSIARPFSSSSNGQLGFFSPLTSFLPGRSSSWSAAESSVKSHQFVSHDVYMNIPSSSSAHAQNSDKNFLWGAFLCEEKEPSLPLSASCLWVKVKPHYYYTNLCNVPSPLEPFLLVSPRYIQNNLGSHFVFHLSDETSNSGA